MIVLVILVSILSIPLFDGVAASVSQLAHYASERSAGHSVLAPAGRLYTQAFFVCGKIYTAPAHL